MVSRHQAVLIIHQKEQELKERKLALSAKKRREFILKIRTWGEWLNLWSFFLGGALLVLIGGVAIGINLPETIICNNTTFPICKTLRIR